MGSNVHAFLMWWKNNKFSCELQIGSKNAIPNGRYDDDKVSSSEYRVEFEIWFLIIKKC